MSSFYLIYLIFVIKFIYEETEACFNILFAIL